jgi:hypothetical protein
MRVAVFYAEFGDTAGRQADAFDRELSQGPF